MKKHKMFFTEINKKLILLRLRSLLLTVPGSAPVCSSVNRPPSSNNKVPAALPMQMPESVSQKSGPWLLSWVESPHQGPFCARPRLGPGPLGLSPPCGRQTDRRVCGARRSVRHRKPKHETASLPVAKSSCHATDEGVWGSGRTRHSVQRHGSEQVIGGAQRRCTGTMTTSATP